MKKVILAVIMGLVVAGGMKEAGAAACCSSPSTGAGIAEGSKGAVSSGRDRMTLSEMMENPSEMAGHEGTMGPCDPVVMRNSEAENINSEAAPGEMANQTESPGRQESQPITPDLLPGDRK